MQIIEPKKLPPETNRFLRQLRSDLSKQSLEALLQEAWKRHKVGIDAYIDVLSRANPHVLKEILMSNQTLEQVFEELGLIAKWEAQGEAKGEARADTRIRREFAQNLILEGFDTPRIAKLTGLDMAAVNALLAEAQA